MECEGTTISCRFFAPPRAASLRRRRAVVAIALVVSLAAVSASRAAPEQSQFLPLVPRWSHELSAPPATPPLVAGAVVVVPLLKGGILGLRVADKSEAWKADLLAAKPITADTDRVYVSSGDTLYALQLSTGEVAWRTKTGTLTVAPIVRDGLVIACSVGGTLWGLRATDGSEVWKTTHGGIEFRPAIDGDLVLAPVVDGRIIAFDLPSGAVQWEKNLGGRPGPPLVAGDRVYVGASNKRFYALRVSNGEIAWPFEVGADARGAPAADEDHVYFITMDNMLRAFNRANGALEWQKRLKFRPSGGPLLIGGAVLVAGPTIAPPVFTRGGAELTELRFPSTLAGISNIVADNPALPSFAMITGDLNQPWTLWMIETSTDPPAIAVDALKTLPGETLAIALPR